MGVILTKVFTEQLTNDSITLQESFGVKKISVLNSTSVDGTVTGDKPLGGRSSSAISITENETITLDTIDASVLTGVTIAAPAGCTLKVVAYG